MEKFFLVRLIRMFGLFLIEIVKMIEENYSSKLELKLEQTLSSNRKIIVSITTNNHNKEQDLSTWNLFAYKFHCVKLYT